MKIEIEATEKEIAALVDMIRGQRKYDCDELADEVMGRLGDNFVKLLVNQT